MPPTPSAPDLPNVYAGLRAAERAPTAPVRLSLPAAADELEQWLGDDRQWADARPEHWRNLLGDLVASWEDCDEGVAEHLAANAQGALQEIRDVRAALGRLKRTDRPDLFLQRRLQRAHAAMDVALRQPAALEAAWHDLEACSPDRESAIRAARRLLDLADAGGYDRRSLARKLAEIIADSAYTVGRARGERPPPGAVHSTAGATEAERLQLAREALMQTPPRGHIVVWLSFELAPMVASPVIEVGDRVTLYAADWLRAALHDPAGWETWARPGELADPSSRAVADVGSLVAFDPPEDGEREVPGVAVRVDLGDALRSQARRIAAETSALVVSFATLHDAPALTWQLTDSHVVLVDGRLSSSTFSAPQVTKPSFEQEDALRTDHTAEILLDSRDELGPHLPLQSEDMRQAAQLLVWLRRARLTWEPGRLILCDRIFEQVCGWAGIASRERFIGEHLRLSWALGRVRGEIGSAVWSAASMWNEGAERIKQDPRLGFEFTDRTWRIADPRAVLDHLDDIIGEVPEGSPQSHRLHTLQERTASGPAAAAWIDDLLSDFDVLAARARRTRNALVHGGPVGELTARAVAPFAEQLAVDALYTAIEGRLAGRDLVDHFLDRRETHRRRLADLEAGTAVADALFGQESAST